MAIVKEVSKNMSDDKKTFSVGVPEMHIEWHSVEAETEEEAKEIVQKRREEGAFGNLEYSHTKDISEWDVM